MADSAQPEEWVHLGHREPQVTQADDWQVANPEVVSTEVKKSKPPRATNMFLVEFFPRGD